jgi:hypothetical protein
MSAETPPPAGKPLIDRLPQHKQDELIAIGREALRRFGYAYQQVFDEHLQIFTFLAAQGATATMIGKMLAEVGIVRKDGSALPAGTVSSALSRARERAVQYQCESLRVPAQTGMNMQVTAGTGTSHADHRNHTPTSGAAPKFSATQMPVPLQPFPEIRPSPNAPVGMQLPATTRRAAALLEQLRSQEDDR